MNVFGTGVDTQSKKGRLAFRGGDIYNPTIVGSDAFHPPWPTQYSRWYCKWPVLPWLCINIGGYGFYIGWKVWGVDAPEYLNYPGLTQADVYSGSLALEPTMRFFTDG